MTEFDGFNLVPAPPQVSRAPTAGLPAETTSIAEIAELDHDGLTKLIEVNGARLVWTRSLTCPCRPTNDETDQPDPRCAECKGRGFVYFGPPDYTPPIGDVGVFDEVQTAIIADSGGGAVIKGHFQRATNKVDPYDVIGSIIHGAMFVTVRAQNLIAYYDRIINLDSNIITDEVITQPPLDRISGLPVRTIPLRYRAIYVNLIMDQNGVRYLEGIDFERTASGQLFWSGAVPAPGTRYAVHLCTHPVWLITEHPHVVRESPRRKGVGTTRTTPLGNPQPQPIQARVQLEWIPKDRDTNADD